MDGRRDEARTKRCLWTTHQISHLNDQNAAGNPRAVFAVPITGWRLSTVRRYLHADASHPKQHLINNVNSRRCALADFRNAFWTRAFPNARYGEANIIWRQIIHLESYFEVPPIYSITLILIRWPGPALPCEWNVLFEDYFKTHENGKIQGFSYLHARSLIESLLLWAPTV